MRLLVWLWRAWIIFFTLVLMPLGSVAWATNPLFGPWWFGILMGLALLGLTIVNIHYLRQEIPKWKGQHGD